MSTIGYDSWAVDLAEVGAIYPFQGSEVLLVIIGVAVWIGWHVWQLKSESKEIAEDVAKADREDSLHNIDSY